MDGLERCNWNCVQIGPGETQAPGDAHAVAPGESEDGRDLGEKGPWRSEPGGYLHEAPAQQGESSPAHGLVRLRVPRRQSRVSAVAKAAWD